MPGQAIHAIWTLLSERSVKADWCIARLGRIEDLGASPPERGLQRLQAEGTIEVIDNAHDNTYRLNNRHRHQINKAVL